MHKTEKVFLWIIKIGLWLIPFLPLYISSSMLFPYITGKNFMFRAIVEVIAALWVALAYMKPEYRPKLTPLVKAVTVLVGIVFLADIFSPNPYRSFFSNYERMEGFMMLGHLYLYFLMLVSVFRRRDWVVFFHMSLVASFLASCYGLLQRLGYYPSLQGGFRVDSTIGNPTYFAAYLLFHIWLLGIFIHRYWATKWRVALYGALLGFELTMIYFTATRGVVLALALAAIPLMGAIVAWWNRITPTSDSGRWSTGRKIAAGALVCVIVLPVIFWSVRKSQFIQQSQALRRLTNYSLHEGTVQDRFMIWGMSLKGVKERPILGWGQENYYLVFQKYFNPGLFAAEQWFDRSHNVFLDWAVHAGIPGLAAYLAIFGVFFWQIIALMRRERRVFFEGLLMIGLFATYFFQNLFVFDNLNSYLLFFAFLAYGNLLTSQDIDHQEGIRQTGAASPQTSLAIAAGMIIAVMIWGYMTIARPMLEAKALIRALGAIQTHSSIPQLQVVFAEALQYRSFGDTEVHEQLAALAQNVAGSDGGTPDERKQFTEFALAEIRKETARRAKDVKHLLFLEAILNRALVLDMAYASEAEAVGREAIALSPAKQPVYYELAQLYLNLNRVEESAKLLQEAWRLEKSNYFAAGNLWSLAAFTGDKDAIAEVSKSIALRDLGEARMVSIARAYQQVGNYDAASSVYAEIVGVSPANPQYHATYAALLAQVGRIEEARKETETAIMLDPRFEEQGRTFLRSLGK
ncbi:MAG: O-antigen ligase family protein [Candidatus Sungbacteria bacterium]|nr:O-antigen ligase family protein [Candidatus Sungbacteria bacterium]